MVVDDFYVFRSRIRPNEDGPSGLHVYFDEPFVISDSARVIASSTCQSPGSLHSVFRQVHEFVFRRDPGGVWELVHRQLLLIT